jgi:hypothetical protein
MKRARDASWSVTTDAAPCKKVLENARIGQAQAIQAYVCELAVHAWHNFLTLRNAFILRTPLFHTMKMVVWPRSTVTAAMKEAAAVSHALKPVNDFRDVPHLELLYANFVHLRQLRAVDDKLYVIMESADATPPQSPIKRVKSPVTATVQPRRLVEELEDVE